MACCRSRLARGSARHHCGAAPCSASSRRRRTSVPLRGNVPTRVRKLAEGQSVDAIVLAAAGLTPPAARSVTPFAVIELPPQWWVPAPGQGALAAQCRAGRHRNRNADCRCSPIPPASNATRWEREFLRVIEGGCSTPFGCHVVGDRAHLGIATERGWAAHSIELPPDFVQRTHNVTHSSAQPSPAASPSSSQKLPLARSAELYSRAEALIPGGRFEPGARLPQGGRHAGVLQAKRAAPMPSTKTATAISTSAWPGVR